jgi:hypothetical protein
MKIDYAVVATDNNPFYDGYWEITQKVWKHVVGVKTILVTVGDEDYHKVFDDYELIGYKKVDDIPTSFQAQVSRLFVTKTYPDKTFLTSDLDMIPLSKGYFIDNAERIDENTLLIYSADAYGYNNQNRYPMCYNLATGKVYNEIMDLNCSYEEFIHRLYSLKIEPLWDTDELYWGKCVNVFESNPNNENRFVKLHRGFGQGAHLRIDRDYWGSYDFSKVKEGYYIDSHLERPYSLYKHNIDSLVNELLNL